jgi:translocation and assembly module TamA
MPLFICLFLCCFGVYGESKPDDQKSTDLKTLSYSINLPQLPHDLNKRLMNVSWLKEKQSMPLRTITQLKKRALKDRERFTKYLFSMGYREAFVDFQIDLTDWSIDFIISLGRLYIFSAPRIKLTRPPQTPLTLDDLYKFLTIKTDDIARVKPILKSTQGLLAHCRSRGHPKAKITKRSVVVNRENATLDVTFVINPGDLHYFGPLTIQSSDHTKTDWIKGYQTWQEGDIYDHSLINKYRQKLSQTEVFSAITFDNKEATDDYHIPLTLAVQENKRRTFNIGAQFSRTERLSVQARWTHRNLFGRGERLTLFSSRSLLKTQIGQTTTFQNFWNRQQNLIIQTDLTRENLLAYKSRQWQASGFLENYYTPQITWKRGIAFSHNTTFEPEKQTFRIVSFPNLLTIDKTDHRLHPTTGYRLKTSAVPHIALRKSSEKPQSIKNTLFVKATSQFSAYKSLSKSVILAGRILGGALLGASFDALPRNKLFFAGGGESIRGYGYQTLGAVGNQGRPTGARFIWETGLEARFRLSKEVGVVTFFDMGQLIRRKQNLPIYYSVGMGARYHIKGLGPLRFDFAIPLRTPNKGFEIYLGIGQTF